MRVLKVPMDRHDFVEKLHQMDGIPLVQIMKIVLVVRLDSLVVVLSVPIRTTPTTG